MADERRFSVGELADLSGVSRRTVRYYVQEGLIPAPHGLGRGAHYGTGHLEQILRVKGMQEQGIPLDAIRRELASNGVASAAAEVHRLVPRSHWSRIALLPGVELHISSERQVPAPRALEELADWCRRHFRRGTDEGREDQDG